jgi:hypothetical protein
MARWKQAKSLFRVCVVVCVWGWIGGCFGVWVCVFVVQFWTCLLMRGHIAWLCSELIDFEERVFLLVMQPILQVWWIINNIFNIRISLHLCFAPVLTDLNYIYKQDVTCMNIIQNGQYNYWNCVLPYAPPRELGNKMQDLRFLTVVVRKSSIFWDIMPCSPLKVDRRFGGTCLLETSVYF